MVRVRVELRVKSWVIPFFASDKKMGFESIIFRVRSGQKSMTRFAMSHTYNKRKKRGGLLSHSKKKKKGKPNLRLNIEERSSVASGTIGLQKQRYLSHLILNPCLVNFDLIMC